MTPTQDCSAYRDGVTSGDLNEDGLVGISDLLLLLSYFGDLCEE